MKTMKRKLLQASVLIAVVSALLTVGQAAPTTTIPTTTTKPTTTATWTTTGPSGLDLKGKMFTLSSYGGGVSFYPPHYPRSNTPWASTSPYTTSTTRPYPISRTNRPYTTSTTRPYPTSTTRPYPTSTSPPWTTPSATRGVSVCLRYLIEQTSNTRIFTLSPSGRRPLLLSSYLSGYTVSFGGYNYMDFRPNIWFWSNIRTDIWTRVCLTVDSTKNEAQVFSSSSISIRKLLPNSYVWSGEPVIDFSGFDGQLTDVQVWDYPLSYMEIFYYMTGVNGSYRGSALTWSSISYSSTGNTLLEDTYPWQAKQPISSRGRGRRPEGEMRKFFNLRVKDRKRRL